MSSIIVHCPRCQSDRVYRHGTRLLPVINAQKRRYKITWSCHYSLSFTSAKIAQNKTNSLPLTLSKPYTQYAPLAVPKKRVTICYSYQYISLIFFYRITLRITFEANFVVTHAIQMI